MIDWKFPVQKLARALGYEISRRGDPAVYIPCAPYGRFTYAPWFEPWFLSKYNPIRDHTTITEDRGYILYRFCQVGMKLPGDMAECGVYQGGTARLIAQTLHDGGIAGKTLHLFDTFSGISGSMQGDHEPHKPGDFSDTNLEQVKRLLADYPFIAFHQGLIPDCLQSVKDTKFSLVHLDLVMHSSTLAALSFFYPRIVPGGILVCDDYGFPKYADSTKVAIDTFLADKAENPISISSGQCLIIKQ